MKITKLAVSQFEGLTALEVTPSNGVNLVEGHNGAGKTSLLEAIRVAFTNKGQRSQLVQDGSMASGTLDAVSRELLPLEDYVQAINQGFQAAPQEDA